MKKLKKTNKASTLTIDEKAEALGPEAEVYRQLLDTAAQASATEGIRQGLEDVKQGRVRAARQVLESFGRKHAKPH
jgi:hypothetical protein